MTRARLLAAGLPVAVDAVACAMFAMGSGTAGILAHLAAAGMSLALTRRWVCGPGARSAELAAAGLALALPGVGVLALAWVLWPSWSIGAGLSRSGIVEVAMPGAAFDVEAATITQPVAARLSIRDVLRGAESPHDRVRAVMALRNMDARRAVPLLRLAFTQESEDVRLLAFAILDRREKALRARIEATQNRLQGKSADPSPTRAKQALWHRRLARDHWEIVYGGFVSGDVQAAVLGQAARHANLALELEVDARTAVLLARIHLRERRAEQAWSCLERAERAGAGRASTAPLFAEAAYLLRRYGEIPELLGRVKHAELQRPELGPVARFWTSARDV